MKTDKSLRVGFEVGHRDVPMPIPAIVGPLLGLVYIIVLPLVGVAALVLASGYRATQSLATMWRRATHATVDVQGETMAEAVGLRDFLQPLLSWSR